MHDTVLHVILGFLHYRMVAVSYHFVFFAVLSFFSCTRGCTLQGASLSGDDGASKKSDAPPSRGPSFGRVDSSRLTLEATASNLKVRQRSCPFFLFLVLGSFYTWYQSVSG